MEQNYGLRRRQSMFGRLSLVGFISSVLVLHSAAQTTNGQINGTVTDSSGAVVPQAELGLTNQGTSQLRTALTDSAGLYIVPQLPPGIYDITVKKQGFATENRPNVQLQVNQNATLNFSLKVSSSAETIQVTGAPPALNTTSATLSDVVGHEATVDLPLNGREFTQLALLTPGAAPIQDSQQAGFAVIQGAGGISPSVNGQRGEQNNFTMDGLLNNQLFTNIWAISPPPDALQEFNVQSHITDAQFAISSGANINIVTRSGTNDFHGSGWEFARNSVLDGRNFFDTKRLPYSQNQYGVFLGGPVILPHFHGKNNTWFAGYWEGFRSSQTLTYFGSTFTAAMRTGDFSPLLGSQVGIDSLGRPEYQNEIYDPATSRPDPVTPGAVLRDPFPGNIIPTSRLNPTAPIILQKYYPEPNLNVGAAVLPNYQFPGTTAIASDVTGIRIDHQFRNNDTLFGRYNRSNANNTTPEPLPGYLGVLLNYAQAVAAGYTHLFGASTILNLHYGYSNMNLNTSSQGGGTAFTSALGFTLNGNPDYGPSVNLSNGYSGVTQYNYPLGPQWASDYHGDLSKTIGHHTLGLGGMYYRVTSYDGGTNIVTGFTQNATSQGALAADTGMGPASFMLGLLDNISGYTGNLTETITANWYGAYLQDQWKASKKATVTAGLRYDYVAPPQPNKVIAGLNFYTGQFIVTGPVLPLFPKATGRSTYYNPQPLGFEPRFGVAYQATDRTVVRAAFAILDDHNNELVQQSQNIRLGWPTGASPNVTLLNRDLPTVYLSGLPPESSFINPLVPLIGQSADPNMRNPYSMEYNLGVEQQLPSSMVLKLDYVGSLSRHQYLQVTANTAPIPGPGSLASRGQPYLQYGGEAFTFETNAGNAGYNALQAELKKSLSSGLYFVASYTWSKSLDMESDPYGGSGVQNFYDLKADRGPSDFNLSQLFVFSGVYALPLGRGTPFLSSPNRFTRGLLGNWNVGTIISLHSGEALECSAGGDIANVGGGSQRCDRIGNPYAGPGFHKSYASWLNPASFTTIPYTFGTEGRNDLVGPSYNDVDFSAFKNFPVTERAKLQFRAEFFNLFNHTNFQNPTNNIQSSAFGGIFSSYFAREIQVAAKLTF
jgi:Carboxypeptidase regulatory-like domain/TonB dependent receptor